MTQRTENILALVKTGKMLPAYVTARWSRLAKGNRKSRKQHRKATRNIK